jgi:hypothetical protein
MGEKISVFMHRTALDRHVAPERGKSFFEARRAIDDDEFWRLQAAVNQIIEERPPGGFALSARSRERNRLTRSRVSTAEKKPPVGRSKIRPVCDRGVKLVLHSFTRETDGTVTDGAFPEAGLIFDINGALYGTTSTGGSSRAIPESG